MTKSGSETTSQIDRLIAEEKRTANAMTNSADAAKSAAETATKSLEVGNRPWVKVNHRIVKPLDFGFVGAGGPAATMTVEDTLENVGQTVALHVLAWEDVIPLDMNSTPCVTASSPVLNPLLRGRRSGVERTATPNSLGRLGKFCFRTPQ